MLHMQVNGEDLAGVMGGEVAHTNFLSGVGEPYVLFLEFTKPRFGKIFPKTVPFRHDMGSCFA